MNCNFCPTKITAFIWRGDDDWWWKCLLYSSTNHWPTQYNEKSTLIQTLERFVKRMMFGEHSVLSPDFHQELLFAEKIKIGDRKSDVEDCISIVMIGSAFHIFPVLWFFHVAFPLHLSSRSAPLLFYIYDWI